MAVAIQANLVQLIVADARRQNIPTADHPLQVSPPGTVTAYREHLIDRHVIQAYSEDEVKIRLREVFGQYCLMNWAFHLPGPDWDFSTLPPKAELRCGSVLRVKVEELNALLWKLRFEQSRRADESFESSPEFPNLLRIAERIPANVNGKPARLSQLDALLAASIEYAGMLHAVRWLAEPARTWNEPGIMDVTTPSLD